MRRLTEQQYRNIIADVFGESIVVASEFDPITRTNGLLAVGAGNVDMTPASFERTENLARLIAAQVMAPSRRLLMIPCEPQTANAPDDTCAEKFIITVGRILFRRPVSRDDVGTYIAMAHNAGAQSQDFYKGLENALTGMLMAPGFLYVADRTEPDAARPGVVRLDAYSKAARLSFFLWNTTPDDDLLTAAENGSLNSPSGLKRQVERMVTSPRLKGGVRAFFVDMLGFDDLDALSKDGIIYPAFSQKVAADAKEQSLRTLEDLLVTRNGDYRDIFTTRKTFLSPSLGVVYQLPVSVLEGWTPYEFPPNDPRAGLVSQISFVALHSHPGKSSPTLRGRAIREVLMCQNVPDPPADVKFDLFFDDDQSHKTARERLALHRTDPACAGCHKIVDPLGLTLENFDGLGQMRSDENGAPIDVSGELDGKPFTGSLGLGKAMHDSPAVPACLVNRLYAYATGRVVERGQKAGLDYLLDRFAADKYSVPRLMRRIAESEFFYAVVSEDQGTKSQVTLSATPEERS